MNNEVPTGGPAKEEHKGRGSRIRKGVLALLADPTEGSRTRCGLRRVKLRGTSYVAICSRDEHARAYAEALAHGIVGDYRDNAEIVIELVCSHWSRDEKDASAADYASSALTAAHRLTDSPQRRLAIMDAVLGTRCVEDAPLRVILQELAEAAVISASPSVPRPLLHPEVGEYVHYRADDDDYTNYPLVFEHNGVQSSRTGDSP